ncbi:hypothetical protein Sjap_025884 [Stephania japonica]|uniref:Uncharacterized protein n=1 Tax=Stephania japonica TaxID=461633 RepID=A0AAP0E5N3_9MAGN
MAESQKAAASTSKSLKKNSLLDEEIGKEFLSSWKSMSIVEDDVLDFDGGTTIPKKKGSGFNFDKLDVDFSFDGDFGKKISSFNIDMSDLDLAGPPEKLVKPKEGLRQESSGGKMGGKRDSFSFSFNFDELDNFDFGSSMMKVDKTPEKVINFKGSDSQVDCSDKQEPNKLVASTAQIENEAMNELDALERVSSKYECLASAHGKLGSESDASPSITESLECLDAFPGKNAPPSKEATDSTNGMDQYSKQSQMSSSIEINDHDVKHSLNENQDFVQELEVDVSSSATEINAIPEGEQGNRGRQIAGVDAELVNTTNLDGSSLTCFARSQTEPFEKLEKQNAPLEYSQEKEPAQCDKNIARVSQKIPDIVMPTMENKLSGSKLPPMQLLRGPEAHVHLPMKEKQLSNICSKFIQGPEENGLRLNKTSMPKKAFTLETKMDKLKNMVVADKACTTTDEGNVSMHQNPAHPRQVINAGDMKVGNQKASTLNLCGGSATRPHGLLGSLKNEDNKASAVFQVTVGSPGKATKISTIKRINFDLRMPRIVPSKTFKSNSIEENKASSLGASRKTFNVNETFKSNSIEENKASPLEASKKSFNINDSRSLRSIAPKSDPLTQKVDKDPKLHLQSEGNRKIPVNTGRKLIHSSSTDADRQGLPSPPSKRKMPEDLDADHMIQHPPKRITGSPSESRKPLEAMENVEQRVCDGKSPLGTSHSTFLLNAPQDACFNESEVSVAKESHGNIHKAEACVKEIDDICNMLKKKQEEAKELLVHAIVNHNNLLLLNHPINQEKIRKVQKFAGRMMCRKLQA